MQQTASLSAILQFRLAFAVQAAHQALAIFWQKRKQRSNNQKLKRAILLLCLTSSVKRKANHLNEMPGPCTSKNPALLNKYKVSHGVSTGLVEVQIFLTGDLR
jgi:hypothetical protein